MTGGLDGTDLRILDLLQENADRSIGEIADVIHLSQNACWRRIRQLEERGFILKRVALLDAVKLGAGTTVFVMVRAGQHTPEWLERFAETVRKIPEIVEFYRMSGDVDYRDVRLGALRGVWRAVRVFGADQVLIVAVDGVDERRLIV